MTNLRAYAIGILCVVFAVKLLCGFSPLESAADRRPVGRVTTSPSSPTHISMDCGHRKYVPSAWETQWVANVDQLAAGEAICPTMQASADMIDQWLAGVAACKQNANTCRPALPGRVFSKFVRECRPAGAAAGLRSGGAGRGIVVEEHIEPLVGHMRHPLALQACVPPGGHAVDVQARNY